MSKMVVKNWNTTNVLRRLLFENPVFIFPFNTAIGLKEERKNAVAIYQTLCYVKDHIEKGELAELKKQAEDRLTKKGFKVDYVEIADAATLKLINHWDGKQKLVALAAAFLNQVRLIDNIIIN